MAFIESNYETFLGWECNCQRTSSAMQYDSAIYQMRDILKEHSLIGYHCTKLTKNEIEAIHSKGMLLQNSDSLNERISCLVKSGLLSEYVAQKLVTKNQADDGNRANMLWFCFYKPYLAGRYGIERFFRSWGGEALYNSHENTPVTGAALLTIGKPCLIKANVPIASLKSSYYPVSSMVRVFLSQRGHQLDNGIEHEGYSLNDIRPENIIEVIEYPSNQFIELTKCDEWETAL